MLGDRDGCYLLGTDGTRGMTEGTFQVTFGPKFNTYYPRLDLVDALSKAGLEELLPGRQPLETSWNRSMKALAEEHSLVFTVAKESIRDKVWAVTDTKGKSICSVLLTYGSFKDGKNFNRYRWKGSKLKVTKANGRTEAQAVCIRDALTEALVNPGVNSYVFHQNAIKWAKEHAYGVLSRSNPIPHLQQHRPDSWYFLLDRTYATKLIGLQMIYDQFQMRMEIKEI